MSALHCIVTSGVAVKEADVPVLPLKMYLQVFCAMSINVLCQSDVTDISI